MIQYIDDWILAMDTQQKILENVHFVPNRLFRLDLQVNFKKSTVEYD